jgi:hypothetical protein
MLNEIFINYNYIKNLHENKNFNIYHKSSNLRLKKKKINKKVPYIRIKPQIRSLLI